MTQDLASSSRETGIDTVGEIPWASHFSLFYHDKRDLVDVLVPYFAAGLLARELCVWMPSNPAAEQQVLDALRDLIPDIDERTAGGQFKITSPEEYRGGGEFDVDQLMKRWDALYRHFEGHAEFSGVRASGDLGWARPDEHHKVHEYELRVHEFLHERQMLILCTYPMEQALAVYMLDSAKAHHFVLARRNGRWESMETPQHRRALREIERLNVELEMRVEERTAQLITERKQATARLQQEKRRARERALEVRFAAILEERTRLAREIHDSLLQGVSGIAMQLRAIVPRLTAAPGDILNSVRRIAELAESTAREARQTVWEIRPVALVHADLPTALRDAAGRAATDSQEMRVAVVGEPRELPPAVEDTILRIAQESMANAVKHSGATIVTVTLDYRPDSVELTITDDGRGFDVESATRNYAGRLGLLGMKERAHQVGADLSVRSSEGVGTTVQLAVRIADTDALEVEVAADGRGSGGGLR
ncbi:MAG TPA: MEDS domain-containing protein [Gemmatimonadaceae bacterium]|nr:MEDS domain-containing protein [Gemmatimonadaceae bacterium]